MAFESIAPVPQSKTLLDLAFQAAKKAATAKIPVRQRLQRHKKKEEVRIKTVKKTLERHISKVLADFPRMDQLSPFYYDLVIATLDYYEVKRSLGAMNWAMKRIDIITTVYLRKVFGSTKVDELENHRRAYYGRVSSIIKQISDNLKTLEQTRKTFRKYPTIKTGKYTVVIAGYPNVGKSTLLQALTGSAPEVASYPFTTQNLMIGNMSGVQIIDTPGLLDRPLAKRNPIERQAALALHHLADLVLFVIDPTEHCGYSVKQQKNLLLEINRSFDNIQVVVNKADMEKLEMKGAIHVSAKENKGIKELKKLILDSAAQAKQEQSPKAGRSKSRA